MRKKNNTKTLWAHTKNKKKSINFTVAVVVVVIVIAAITSLWYNIFKWLTLSAYELELEFRVWMRMRMWMSSTSSWFLSLVFFSPSHSFISIARWCFLQQFFFSKGDILLLLLLLPLLFYCRLRFCILHKWINYGVAVVCVCVCAFSPGINLCVPYAQFQAFAWKLATWKTGKTLVLHPYDEPTNEIYPKTLNNSNSSSICLNAKPHTCQM